jgi:hypothetical protein
MMVVIQGTRTFTDYNVFLRAMGTALSMMEDGDKQVNIYSAGPSNINSMGLEVSNISDNLNDSDYIAYFCKPKEPVSDIVDLAEARDLELGIYRF